MIIKKLGKECLFNIILQGQNVEQSFYLTRLPRFLISLFYLIPHKIVRSYKYNTIHTSLDIRNMMCVCLCVPKELLNRYESPLQEASYRSRKGSKVFSSA